MSTHRLHPMDSRPRILMDGRPLLDPTTGGIFEYASRLLTPLRASTAFSVEVWANRFKGDFPNAIDHPTRWPNKVLHAGIWATGRPRIDRLVGRRRPELFWAPNPHFIALSPEVPLALTIHDLSFECYPEFFSLKQRLWHAAVAPRRLARLARRVLTVSDHAKSELVALYGLDPKKIDVTPAIAGISCRRSGRRRKRAARLICRSASSCMSARSNPVKTIAR